VEPRRSIWKLLKDDYVMRAFFAFHDQEQVTNAALKISNTSHPAFLHLTLLETYMSFMH